ncbi:TPA: PHP domain-containing protein [Klebsiella oxytoca]|nr:PHP domain-containing protein [Klebsiella oxytoca]
MSLKIDLHLHTLASAHAYSTVYEYIQEAKRQKMIAIAITDHGPALNDSPHPWHFLNMNALPNRIDGIRILKGMEANIYKDGTIDCDAQSATQLDFIMAGFHTPLYPPNMDLIQNTNCLLKVISNPLVRIISHPGNANYPVDYEAIAEAAAHHHVALEVNSGSATARKGSTDNCRRIIRAVRNAGGFISVGSDAHYCSNVGNLEHSISLLAEQNFPNSRIINSSLALTLSFLDVDEALHW